MDTKIHVITDTKDRPLGFIHAYLEHPFLASQTAFLDSLIEKIPDEEEIGYAGFEKKEYLKEHLAGQIFDSNEKKAEPFEGDAAALIEAVGIALQQAQETLPSSPVHVFLFPTFSTFVAKEMRGATGYTPYQNTLLVFVSFRPVTGQQDSLKETLIHEYVHAVMDNFHERKTLLDDLIFEGLAESFAAELLGKNDHMPSQALSEKEAIDWFAKLKDRLDATDLYYPVFLAGKDYPLWAGYAVGYCIAVAYRKRHPKTTWPELVRMSPQEIYAGSGLDN